MDKTLNELIGELQAEIIYRFDINRGLTLEETITVAKKILIQQERKILDLNNEIFELKGQLRRKK